MTTPSTVKLVEPLEMTDAGIVYLALGIMEGRLAIPESSSTFFLVRLKEVADRLAGRTPCSS